MKSLKKFIKFSNKMLKNGFSYNIEKCNCEKNIKHGASSANNEIKLIQLFTI